jgi:hypothetical protein
MDRPDGVGVIVEGVEERIVLDAGQAQKIVSMPFTSSMETTAWAVVRVCMAKPIRFASPREI